MTTAPRSSLGLAQLIQTYLAAQLTGVTAVYSMLELSGARRNIPRGPVAGALVLSDEFQPPLDADDDERVVQRHVSTVAVVCGVDAVNDPGGRKGGRRGETLELLDGLIQETRRALIGWPPEGENVGRMVVNADATMMRILGPGPEERASDAARWRPLVPVRGRLVAIDDGSGRAWWQDEYRTSRLVRGVEPMPCPAETPTELCVDVNDEGPMPLRSAG